MTVERRGEPLGGFNIQAIVGAPDYDRRGLDEDVVMWLPSGWWISLRNQFAQAPDVAVKILELVAGQLTAVTEPLAVARGDDVEPTFWKLKATIFDAVGPDYWR